MRIIAIVLFDPLIQRIMEVERICNQAGSKRRDGAIVVGGKKTYVDKGIPWNPPGLNPPPPKRPLTFAIAEAIGQILDIITKR